MDEAPDDGVGGGDGVTVGQVRECAVVADRGEEAIDRRFSGMLSLIGNTPLLAIDVDLGGLATTVYAKAEQFSLTGSIKDRMALHMMRRAYERGELRPGMPIIEATSGNTGISFAAIGKALGHPVTIFMPDWMSRERIDLIRGFGAEIRLVGHDEGGFLGSIELAEREAERLGEAFLPRQFSNEDNSASHVQTTGPEIWWQLQSCFVEPDAFVAGVGTGGTVMGVGRYLRRKRPDVAVHPVEAAEAPVLSTGSRGGEHRIQGISDEFVPSLVDLGFLDEPIAVHDGDAILMAQKLATELGLGVGISSGANFVAALRMQERLGPDAVVATVFADDNKKYLSTSLVHDEPVAADYFSPAVALTGFRSYRRDCHTCCDPAVCGGEAPPGFVPDREPLPVCVRPRHARPRHSRTADGS